jgi:hypothetical protein
MSWGRGVAAVKKAFFIFMTGGILGLLGGIAVGFFVYPYIFLADIVATEAAPDPALQKVVARGAFIHADPSDPIHHGKGRVTVYGKSVRLEPDFEVGPGPKYHVYLVPSDRVTPDTPVEKTMFVDLGRLRAFKGSQNYPIPAGLDLKAYGHVVIWCEQFGVLISPAKLRF